MLIIKAKYNMPREEMKKLYERLHEQMQHGLVLVDDSYEISVVEPSMEWVPISEKLPEKGKEVLFTTNEKHVWTGVWDGKRYFEIDDEGRTIEISEITAWMPLPAPYKIESEDKENG